MKNSIEIGERIKTVRELMQMSHLEFAAIFGIKEAKEANKKVDNLQRGRGALTAFEMTCFKKASISTEYIEFGKGAPFSYGSDYQPPKAKGIPLYDVAASAGTGLAFDTQTKIIAYFEMPNFSDCQAVISVFGDSMLPVYRSGDKVVLKEITSNIIPYGQVFVITVKEGVGSQTYLKLIFPCSDGRNEIILRSYNSDYPDIPCMLSDIQKLFIVKGSIRQELI